MRQRLSILMGLVLGIVFILPIYMEAQDKKAKETEDRISGVVQSISKDKSMYTARLKGNVTRTVVWDAKTTWTWNTLSRKFPNEDRGLKKSRI